MSLVLAGVLYFAVTYAAGFVFGSLRELIIVPRLGQVGGILLEAPIMLAVTYFAARWVVGRFDAPLASGELLTIGGVGFALLMAAEASFSGLMRGLSIEQWLSQFKTADGAISLAMFILFAVMPLLVVRG